MSNTPIAPRHVLAPRSVYVAKVALERHQRQRKVYRITLSCGCWFWEEHPDNPPLPHSKIGTSGRCYKRHDSDTASE